MGHRQGDPDKKITKQHWYGIGGKRVKKEKIVFVTLRFAMVPFQAFLMAFGIT